MSNALYLSSSRLMLPASLKGKNLFGCHTEMIPWTADFATSVAWRGGMLRVMMPGGKCAWFDAVALSAYEECPAPVQEDRRRYLRRRRFNVPSAARLAPRPPNAYSPELVYTSSTISLAHPSEPFIVSFLRLSPPPQTQGWVHNAADLKKKLHFCGGGVENYFFSRLRPGSQTIIPLLPSTVHCSIPGERPSSCSY